MTGFARGKTMKASRPAGVNGEGTTMPAEVDENGLPGGVGLAEAIQALRAELTQAMENAPDQGVRFRPGPVELTVEAALTKNFGGKAGIKWWLIEAGGEASRESAVTQTLKITLQPILLNARGEAVDLIIADEDDSPMDGPRNTDMPAGDAEPG